MKDLVPNARKLRRDQMDAEKKLWRHLRNRQLEGFKFKRQHPIPPYIADFFCEEKGVVVEVDGGQHSPETDNKKTKALEKHGFEVIRFWNNEVLSNMEGVLQTLLEKLNDRPTMSPHPAHPRNSSDGPPSPKGEGKKKRICLGTIVTAHGVKGLVKVKCDADDPHLLDGPLYTSEKGQDTLTLSLKNSMGKYWLAQVEGVNDRDAALALRGTKLWIFRNQLPTIENEDEFYFEDLIGLAVETADGKQAGKVIAVENFGAGDLLEIKPLKGETYYIPFTEEYVPEINDNFIVISLPENLR